jgi:citrate synthase
MSGLKKKLSEKINEHRPRTLKLMNEYGGVVVDEVTIEKIIGGMRSLKSLVTDISYLDPQEGIRYRGYTLPEVFEGLPKPKGSESPYVEGLFYLLLTGDMPTEEEVGEVIDEFRERRVLPDHVYDSLFNRQYLNGISKMDYWEPTYEDALNLVAKLPEIGSYIYARLYKKGRRVEQNPDLDMGGNFAYMMGQQPPYDDVSRMYFILHADHESGNVSAHTGHLVASALSDIYLSISAMINGLAGPLHGLANQEVLRWLQDLMKKMDGRIPSEEEMKQFVWDTLNAGQVIPGFGHAVLRKTDPRYMVQREFALKHMQQDELFQYVDMLYKVVPPILQEHGHAKNPWPNVDAHSGVIQWHYGITEYEFYTVLFGIGRALGITANIIWDRALLYPLERPKSLTTSMLEEIVQKAGGGA